MRQAAVVGASGYAGGELLRLLLGHPELEIGPLLGVSSAGRSIADVHRHLPMLGTRTIEDLSGCLADGGLADVDVVFLALPHGASGAVVDAMGASRSVVVDLGADHRLASPDAWAHYYGGEWAGEWTYGLPELAGQRSLIAGARQIANPGCYPTGVAVGMTPLLAAGLAQPRDVVVVAASGTTGAGRTSSPTMSASEVVGSMSVYKAGGAHQHTPEMAQSLSRAAGAQVAVSFTPVLAPMARGIVATTSAPVELGVSTADVRACLQDAYRDEPFVIVLDDDVWPRTADVTGGNAVHLQAGVDDAAGRVVVVSAIDNLVKGAAGQAIQNANIALGLAETSGLSAAGVAP